jgi:hydroxymethylpyrimidine/phosphomethylpyrimidine kinase
MVAHGEVAVALTIAGSDCSAGAGAQADLKTFAAAGVYGLTAITCIVAETPGKVSRIQAVDVDVVAEQITLLLDAFPVGAIKTGLLYSGEIVAGVAEALRAWRAQHGRAIPLVIDPVMVATSGDLLLRREAIATYERELFPLASLLTPNLDEVATLLGRSVVDLDSMHEAGAELLAKYNVPVLLKGGHLGGTEAIDLLFTASGVTDFRAPFTRDVRTHGTGCTYSAAIAAGIASGLSLADAIRRAKRFVSAAIEQHFSWHSGGDAHLHALNHSAQSRTPSHE